MDAAKIGQLPPEVLQKIGHRVVDYFNDVGECLLCDVDADRVPGGPPVHEEHCSLHPSKMPSATAGEAKPTGNAEKGGG
jgi:hypothetical protein